MHCLRKRAALLLCSQCFVLGSWRLLCLLWAMAVCYVQGHAEVVQVALSDEDQAAQQEFK